MTLCPGFSFVQTQVRMTREAVSSCGAGEEAGGTTRWES